MTAKSAAVQHSTESEPINPVGLNVDDNTSLTVNEVSGAGDTAPPTPEIRWQGLKSVVRHEGKLAKRNIFEEEGTGKQFIKEGESYLPVKPDGDGLRTAEEGEVVGGKTSADEFHHNETQYGACANKAFLGELLERARRDADEVSNSLTGADAVFAFVQRLFVQAGQEVSEVYLKPYPNEEVKQ